MLYSNKEIQDKKPIKTNKSIVSVKCRNLRLAELKEHALWKPEAVHDRYTLSHKIEAAITENNIQFFTTMIDDKGITGSAVVANSVF